MKQVHRIRLRTTARSKARWVYFVNHSSTNASSSAAHVAQDLLHRTQTRPLGRTTECLLEFPLVFVDNAFGLDASGVRVAVEHPVTKVTQVVPAEQAKLLLVWNFVKLP